MTVRCVGSDMEKVKLFKGDREVEGDSSHQIRRTDTKVELKISPVSPTDQGVYSCVNNGNILQKKTMRIWGKYIKYTPV